MHVKLLNLKKEIDSDPFGAICVHEDSIVINQVALSIQSTNSVVDLWST